MKLRQLKQVRGMMTQEELADKSGIQQSAISRIESGLGARRATILALAKALGVDPSELVGATAQEAP